MIRHERVIVTVLSKDRNYRTGMAGINGITVYANADA